MPAVMWNAETMFVLSYIQAKALLGAGREGKEKATTSLDLNLSQVEVTLTPEGVVLPDAPALGWREVEKIARDENTSYMFEDGTMSKIQQFSAQLNRLYSLKPTEKAPTLLISGIPMHRIKGIDPHEDTLRKIAALAPVYGRVLDTTTGLGYTAIEAAKTPSSVLTIELDPTVLEIARSNPWSRDLFESPKITQQVGNSAEVVSTLDAQSFDFVFHDPPTVSLGGELYSEEFYRALFRVLKRGGKLFHYVGNLESKAGSTVARGAMRRLQEAGFVRVSRRDEAFGLIAQRP
ncbi:MAG TPA: methyltransferase domain-containing protein [Capsulimonadaceae bacterium]|nr:methyltransferase domain-containing protein [Capsulimonadaceae bacterium]